MKTINNDTFLNGKELNELFSLENVVKQMNKINKAIYDIEPYKLDEVEERRLEENEIKFKLTDEN